MKSTLVILLLLLSASTQLWSQTLDTRLYDHVVGEIEKTRAKLFARDSLLKPNFKAPEVSRYKPIILVNKKQVDLHFLKYIAITDTVEVQNRGEMVGFHSPSITRRFIIGGWISIKIDKRVFRDLWKVHKDAYSRKEKS